jgi:hypothetical protein
MATEQPALGIRLLGLCAERTPHGKARNRVGEALQTVGLEGPRQADARWRRPRTARGQWPPGA